MKNVLINVFFAISFPSLTFFVKNTTKVAKENVSSIETGKADAKETSSTPLFLIEKAAQYIQETVVFEQKVKDVADCLDIPAEWIMAIIHSESNFDPHISNHYESGAKGLIQWMPATLKELGYQRLPKNAIAQLDLVEAYFDSFKKRNKTFRSLTDLKIAVLYPKALGKSKNYQLYTFPSVAYYQNERLDYDKNGIITVADVEKTMKLEYEQLYQPKKGLVN